MLADVRRVVSATQDLIDSLVSTIVHIDSSVNLTSAASAGVATKLGTADVGDSSTPIYLASGIPTACTDVQGGEITSVASAGYAVSAGTATQLGTTTVGNVSTPVYISSGVPQTCEVATVKWYDSSSDEYSSPMSLCELSYDDSGFLNLSTYTSDGNSSSARILTYDCFDYRVPDITVSYAVYANSAGSLDGYVGAELISGVVDQARSAESATEAWSATNADYASSADVASSADSAGVAFRLADEHNAEPINVGNDSSPVYFSSGVPVSCVSVHAVTATNAVSASVATQVGTTDVGNTSTPIYLSGGMPTACSVSGPTTYVKTATITSHSDNNYELTVVDNNNSSSTLYAIGANFLESAYVPTMSVGTADFASNAVNAMYTSEAASCIGNAATATSATSATVATKIGTANVGDSATPVYLSGGVPTACTAIQTGPTTYVQSIAISSYTGVNRDPLVELTYVDQNGNSSSISGIVTDETFYYNVPDYTVAGANEATMAQIASALGSGTYDSPSWLSVGDSATPVYFSYGVPSTCDVASMNVGYADSAYSADSAGFADSATVADSSYALVEQNDGDPYNVGTATRPVYFQSGKPVSCGTSLAVSCTSATSAGSAASAASADVATKVGTVTVGNASSPIYLNLGVPTAITTVASATNAATAASCTGNAATATSAISAGYAASADRVGTTTIGTTTRPVYISSGIPVSCGTSLAVSCTSANSAGSAVSAASCTGNAATATSAVSAGYAVSAGRVGTTTVGSTTRPVYISSGIPVSCGTSLAVSCTSANSAGSAVSAASCTGNAATATSAVSAGYAVSAGRVGTTTVGSTTRPVYISSGIPVSCGTSLAVSCTSANSAGYANSAGKIGTATVGSLSKPVYISSGVPAIASKMHYTSGVSYVHNVGAQTTTVDLATNHIFRFDIQGNTTFTFTNLPAANEVCEVVFILENAGSYTITWPTGIVWAGGRTPLLTTGTDIVNFTIIGG